MHNNIAATLDSKSLVYAHALTAEARARKREEEAHNALHGLRRSVQVWALAAINTPYDAPRLRNLDGQIDDMVSLLPQERDLLKHFIRTFGRRDRKRPRDRLLRDRTTKKVVMEVRKKTAFLGYTWRRMRPLETTALTGKSSGTSSAAESPAHEQHPLHV